MLPSSTSDWVVIAGTLLAHGMGKHQVVGAETCSQGSDAVAGESLEKRVELLEQQMRPLSELPDRVASFETQFLQFRTEVRAEFSAVRSEKHAGDERLL